MLPLRLNCERNDIALHLVLDKYISTSDSARIILIILSISQKYKFLKRALNTLISIVKSLY